MIDSLVQAIGNTPLVRLKTIEPPGVEIHAKLEWFNPGGSVKDRAALQIIRDALARGDLQSAAPSGSGRTLLDSTSGNTGIAYAWIGAALQIPVALVMPSNVSEARKRIARAFGAQIIFSDPMEQSDGAIRLARKLAQEEPAKWFYADQYSNEANPRAHVLGTAEEIWRQTEGRVTHVVLGIGTGGTVMGTGRGLRAKNPAIQVIAVEPAEPMHGLEGLKHMPSSIVPRIYKEEELTRKLSIDTDSGWDMADRLIRDEGLLAGHSAGAAAEGALRVARELKSGVVVTLFPDRADRYLPPAP
ncbi:MAG TPA: cysteine synthase family protein [Myxococcales bacterium]|jgi:cysteine synthase B|nr:cysteine synthase family protein [Myxococcales bacterium]